MVQCRLGSEVGTLMKKKELLELPALRATKTILSVAMADKLMMRKKYYGSCSIEFQGYEYGRYIRSRIFNGILKVSIFLPEHLRMGTRAPAFEIFVDAEKAQFLTYDRVGNRWLTAKLDCLPWPRYVLNSSGIWIGKASYRHIKNYLGGTRGGYEGLLDYQLKVRKDALTQQYRRETEPWDADLAQIPDVPKDWQRWCSKVGIPENYIFYQYSRKGANTGYCTYCEKEVPIRKPHHNQSGRCPCCRKPITYKSIGKSSYKVCTDTAFMYLIQRCMDGFVIRQFSGTRSYTKTERYRQCDLSVTEQRRAIYSPNNWKSRVYCWDDYRNRETRWVPSNRVYQYSYWRTYWHQDWEGVLYGKTLPTLFAKELKYSGLQDAIHLLHKIDPEHYLRTLNNRPILEQLVKAGLGGLVKDLMQDNSEHEEIKMIPGTGLARTLGIDAQEMKRLRQSQGGWAFLNWLRYEKTIGREIPNHTITWFCEQKIEPKDLNFLCGRMSPVQVCNYLRRQMCELRMGCRQVLTTWDDYLAMASRLKLNMDSSAVYRVKNVKKRHDELLKFFQHDADMAIRAGKILKKYPHIEEIFEEIRPKYEYADPQYTILVPTRIEDIMTEGTVLSHCVGNVERYWERMERRESYVLFLRRTKETDKPYYTLEVEPNGTIRQKRTLGDDQLEDIEQASSFLRKWQKVIAKRLTAEDLALAKASRVLRMKEFEELRENQVTIRTGKLAGTSLLAVLQADLMEAA